MKNQLKSILEAKEMSAYKLAKITGIKSQHIYSIMSGKEFAYPSWRKRIAEALQLPEESIFSAEERGDLLED